jgi:nitronate monooxygenase
MSIQQLFDIQQPILQAPMVGASNPHLVSAVSNSGGLGGLGAAAMKPAFLRDQIRAIKGKTDKPFNVNLFAPGSEVFDPTATISDELTALMLDYHDEMDAGDLPLPSAIFGPVEEQLAVLIEEKVPVISFHFGLEPHHVEAIHQANLKVICSATTIAEARHLEQAGVDAVIAQGTEAGGHRGTFIGDYRQGLIGTLALVPQVVDAINLPVIAAGGIMDARGILACRALGASGVQLGTAFLGCPEAGIPHAWKHALLNCAPESTTVTTVMSGKPARGIRNRYIDEVEALDTQILPYPLQYSLSGALRKAATEQDNPDFLALWSGQGVGMIKEMTAAALMDYLVEETKALAQKMSRP